MGSSQISAARKILEVSTQTVTSSEVAMFKTWNWKLHQLPISQDNDELNYGMIPLEELFFKGALTDENSQQTLQIPNLDEDENGGEEEDGSGEDEDGSSEDKDYWSVGVNRSFITCFCPCVTFGQTSEIVNRGYKSCSSRGFLYGVLALTGFACFYSCFYRSKLRAQYDLPEEPCADCMVHFCCPGCALCQEYRELRNRGFDMSIGWEANMDRQKRGITLAPAVVPAMSR
ncbi:hypothetical protein SLEP1_g14081 [Rubroshorea leprosula]|uniref:Uncharacterized protein n=1 Tax=Rubroshorea leprosula TaxID=152421 RepID=A0AAV5ISC6_9ROSI|nr:hypothetical protein SLEP1_g14081 [Rubroshorea leprosula]